MGGGPTDQAEVFVGVGAVVDVTAGTINTDDAIGLDADVDELTLAIVTTGGSSPVRYTGLSITNLSASLVGITDLVAKATASTCRSTWSPTRPSCCPRPPTGSTGPPTRPRAASATSPRWAASTPTPPCTRTAI